MTEGDPLIYPIKPTGEIAIGRVSGPYRFTDDDAELVQNDYCNTRGVKWLKIVPRTVFTQPALHSFGSFLSVSTSNDHLEEVIQVLIGVEAEVGPDVPELDEGQEVESNLFETATQETADFLLKAWHRTGARFEEVVKATLESVGYTARTTPASGDHGVDVIAHPDPLGLKEPYIKVQVKSGTSRVGEPEVNQLKGLLNPGEQGIFVSLGGFTNGALAIERGTPNLTLIDAQRFVELFSDHYDALDPAWRARYPLRKVLVPFTNP
jgi:restriction system protein